MKGRLAITMIFISNCMLSINGWLVVDGMRNVVDSIGSVGSNVKALFSPNLHTAYSFNLENLHEIVHNREFDKNLPTVVYIHGFLGDGEFDESVMAVRNAYRKNKNQNFIAIDWSAFSRLTVGVPYYNNIRKLRQICEEIAVQLNTIRNQGCSCYRNFYLVGHSLGGQCAGLVGRHLKKISNNNFVISKIYALDPAGPDFESKSIIHLHKSFDCISRNDAEYVQIIHTNGNRYGLSKSVGHADFYPNGGMSQPGCRLDTCSHSFAWIFYQQSVRGEGGFLARQCDSYDNFQKGNCGSNEISFMGYSSNGTRPMGTYYLRTHPSKYGPALGEEGLNNFDSYLILEDGTKTSDTENHGYRSLSEANQIPLNRFNELLRKQEIQQNQSRGENSSE